MAAAMQGDASAMPKGITGPYVDSRIWTTHSLIINSQLISWETAVNLYIHFYLSKKIKVQVVLQVARQEEVWRESEQPSAATRARERER